ncbi:hypothetical protein [Rheinheimera hassiensis]|uniref:hypothetical protein n=1 Tax=Rheinheimera hassiensis TaxID=1193627 RepID=UPI001F05EBC3|nr:hypothetical protein [Rheinheimera hassiensis]
MQNTHLFMKPGEPKSIFEDKLSALLASLPDGVRVGYEITNGSVVWSVQEKPVSVSREEEQTFLEELNQLSLRFSSPNQRKKNESTAFDYLDPNSQIAKETVSIKEIEDSYAKYAAGEGELTLYENMPDKVILKLVKNAITKAKGAKFSVQMLPDWNEPE